MKFDSETFAMAQRRASQLELCFDSMTDLITNLAGGLVLVVLLLLGMTQESKKVEQQAEFAAAKKKSEGGAKSIQPLEIRSQALRAEIAAVEKNMSTLEAKLPKLQQDVEDLLERASKAKQKK